MDFSQVTEIEIPEGKVTKIQDSLGNTIWEANTGPKNCLMFSSQTSFQMASYNSSSGTTVAKYWNGTIQYSTDGTTWNEWDGSLISSGTNNKLYFRGTGNTHINRSSYARWYISGSNVSCIGNIETLLDWETVVNGNHPTMDSYCYNSMFYGCTSLTTPPELPATTLASYCYDSMFYGCTSLTTPPELPATTLASYCYSSMFDGCTSLTTPPELPATTLAYYCYAGMFYGCTSLTTAPKLPATTLASTCYRNMFWGCTSLITVPSLPATTIEPDCYNSMFRDCTKLKFSTTKTEDYQNEYRIPTSGTGSTASGWNSLMFLGTGGTFTGGPAINTTYYTSNEIIPVHIPPPADYLTFSSTAPFEMSSKNASDSSVVSVNWNGTIYYSQDEVTWKIWDGNSISSGTDNKLYIAGSGNTHINTSSSQGIWTITGSDVSCSGNIETVLDWEKASQRQHPTMDSYCFYKLFYGNTALVAPPDLLATTVTDSCCYSMFQDCTSLTSAPILSATTLATNCYYSMFYGCTSLREIPALPGRTLKTQCYYNMFRGCSLIKISTTSTGEYEHEYRIPIKGASLDTETYWNRYMFTSTGGTFTGNPSADVSYYTSNPIVQ